MQKQPTEVFIKKSVYKNFAIFIGKHLYQKLFLIKLQVVRSQEHLLWKTSANDWLVHNMPLKNVKTLIKARLKCLFQNSRIRKVFALYWPKTTMWNEQVSKDCLNCFVWVVINQLSASVALIQKPVNWFALQINWLVSIWG